MQPVVSTRAAYSTHILSSKMAINMLSPAANCVDYEFSTMQIAIANVMLVNREVNESVSKAFMKVYN